MYLALFTEPTRSILIISINRRVTVIMSLYYHIITTIVSTMLDNIAVDVGKIGRFFERVFTNYHNGIIINLKTDSAYRVLYVGTRQQAN